MTDQPPPLDPPGGHPTGPADAEAGAARDHRPAELSDEDIVAARRVRQGLDLRERTERLATELTAVAVRLDQALAGIEQIREWHAVLAAAVSEGLGPDVAELQGVVDEELGRLRAQVDALLAEREQQKTTRDPPVNWAALDAQHAAAAWPSLARWIGQVLVPLYELTRDELPDCWALHRPVVAELSWLHTAHTAAYRARAAPQAAADWHTRWLPAVLDRIRVVIKTDECYPGQHTPQHGPVLRLGEPGNAGAARRQTATPRCWWSYYELAFREDLAARRARAGTGEQNWTPAPAVSATA